MGEYIDRQAALDAIATWDKQDVYPPCLYEMVINDVPSADVEPVVRCKDCKHRCGDYCHNDDGFAHFDHFFVQDDDYCSRGERMDGEEE